jgi:hypothetical protein
MQSYYKVFGATANRELFWTAPYLDASGLGMMVTAALPTYDTSQEYPELLGVVGHDILLSDFTALVSTFNSDRSYAFLVDRRGNAISHPRMSANTNPNAAPIYQDISVLENNNSTEFLSKVRQPLLSGQPGKQKLIAVRVLTRGDSSDGVTFERVAVTYVWRPVGPFVACYVLADDDVVSLVVEDGDVRWPSYYHNLKLYGDTINRALRTTQFPSSHGKYPNALLLTNATTFYLAPRAFVDPAGRVRREPTESAGDVAVLHAAINEEGRTDESSGLRTGIRALTRRLSELDALWSGVDQNETALGWIYFGAAQGVHRRYPGGDQAFAGYDPTVRPWYLRAKALPNALVVSAPYTDASGLGRVCTLAHTVPRRALDSSVGGVIGLDFQHAAFQAIVHTNRSACFGGQRESCFAIESSGLLVTSEVARHDVRNARDAVFIGTVEPGVTQALIAAGFLEPQSYVDFQAQQECQAFKANNGALDAVRELQVSTCGSGTIRVRAVTIDDAVTNMYLIQVSDWRSSANGCVTARRGCFALPKPSPCKPMEMSALPRAKAPCSKVVITEEFLEHLRAQDPDGGLCGGSLSSVEIAVIVICVILGVILLCIAVYCIFFKKRNGSQPKPNY